MKPQSKRMIWGAVLVVAILAMVAVIYFVRKPAAEPAMAGFATYASKDLGYSIQYPEQWRVQEQDALSKEVIMGPADAEDFTSYVSVSIDQRAIEVIRNVFSIDQGAWKEETITFANQPSYQFTGQHSATKHIFIPHENVMYLLSTDKAGDPQVERSLSSFKFTDNLAKERVSGAAFANLAAIPDDECGLKVKEQIAYLNDEKFSGQYTFEKHPHSKEPVINRLAALDASSSRSAAAFRTKIEEAMQAAGINFAGHYSIVSVSMTGWGPNYWIIDRTTGKAHEFPYKASDLDFRRDSELIVMDSRPYLLNRLGQLSDYTDACANMGAMGPRLMEQRPFYFRWNVADQELELLAGSHPPENTFWEQYFK